MKGENSIKLYGNDLHALTETANKIKAVLVDRAGRHRSRGVHIARAADHPDRRRPRQARARCGLSPGDINATIKVADRRRHRRRSL